MKIYSYAHKKECKKTEECAAKLKPFFKDEESIVKNLSKNESFIIKVSKQYVIIGLFYLVVDFLCNLQLQKMR